MILGTYFVRNFSNKAYVEKADAPQNNVAIGKSINIDHTSTKLSQIPLEWIEKAKEELHILYGHTSHGSQIIGGLMGLTKFKKSPYIYREGAADSIDLRSNPFESRMDLGTTLGRGIGRGTLLPF